MASRKVILQRHWKDENQSTGSLLVVDTKTGQPVFLSPCIERGDRNNKRMVSNVPAGLYKLVYEWSPRFKRKLWELKGVPGRSECKIHPANMWNQLNGCIAPGSFLGKVNNDGYYDVLKSTIATALFHAALKGITRTTIEIID